MSYLSTYIRTIGVRDSRGDLKPNTGDTHSNGITNPTRGCIMRDANAINDSPDRECECKPKRVKAGLGNLNAIMLLSMSIHQPVHKPPGGGFAKQIPNEQRNAQYETDLDYVKPIERGVYYRTCSSKQYRAIREARHVVDVRYHDTHVAGHFKWV